MRVPSVSSNAVRRRPQQDRATLRVAAFIKAAESLFAENGFEATTMTEVAERAGSSIGALYNYFPDKRSLAMTLMTEYAHQIEAHWQPLFSTIHDLSGREFAERFIDRFLQFVDEHPAYLQLQAAPIRFRRDPEARRAFRATLIQALRQRCPELTQQDALLKANVAVQLVKGMMALYADADASGKTAVVSEFKQVLALYLKSIFPKR
jgi:AcrR family transcriptional regulator